MKKILFLLALILLIFIFAQSQILNQNAWEEDESFNPDLLGCPAGCSGPTRNCQSTN